MTYKIELSKTALKFLKRQPKNQQVRILKAIYRDIKKLVVDIGNRGQIYK